MSRSTNVDWLPGGGNHRLVAATTDSVASVAFERRWHDPRPPDRRGVKVVGQDGRSVLRWGVVDEGPVHSRAYFEASSGAGEYRVYVLPVDDAPPAHYPQDHHTELTNPDLTWLAGAIADARPTEISRWEHRSDHHAWDPMELRATSEEAAELATHWPAGSLPVFAEDAGHPVRLRTAVPTCWLGRRPGDRLEVAVRPEGRNVFQLALWAAGAEAQAPSVAWDGPSGLAFVCFNQDRLAQGVAVGEVLSLWWGIQAIGVEPGTYHCRATVAATGPPTVVPVDIVVGEGPDPDAPYNRLWWLESDDARSAGPTAAYTPVTVEADTLQILGRTIRLGALGLPASIVSRFASDGQSLTGPPTELLAEPIRLTALDPAGTRVDWGSTGPTGYVTDTEGVSWSSGASGSGLSARVDARLEFDGTMVYEVDLTAEGAVNLADVRLEVPLRSEAAEYLMGLGHKGGRRQERIDWTWQTEEHNQDAVWIGTPHAGLQLSLRDDHYVRPLNTNFYRARPLVAPQSWANEGRGRIVIADRPSGLATDLVARSGPCRLETGEHRRFDFRLMLTPFKPIDMSRVFRRRYLHDYVDPDDAVAAGATTVNIHHTHPPNPYLNYPLLAAEELQRYVEACHERGVSVRIYDTIRELTTRAPELWPMLQLGDELFFAGSGGGQSWLQEHIDHPYLAGWYAREVDDTTLVTTAGRRWENFYVASLARLRALTGLDGLYLDDVAFDRDTMKRVRHVLEAGADPDIDLHSANQFNPKDGFASSANLYLELMPFLDRLWFGEYFDYEAKEDYWLVEVSGLPYGLTGEMLQDGGHPWRGMLYGMTNRLGHGPTANPRPLWNLWDRAGLSKVSMQGYWLPSAPVKTGRDDVLGTAFVSGERTLLALASWSESDTAVELDIDWDALGLGSAERQLSLPGVDGLQSPLQLAVNTPVIVPAGKGAFVVLGKPVDS